MNGQLSMSSLYEFECKLYHQHLGHGADAEDIHGDADLHGRTCNQQKPSGLGRCDYPPMSNQPCRTYRVRDKQISRDNSNNNSSNDESTFTSDSRALYVAR